MKFVYTGKKETKLGIRTSPAGHETKERLPAGREGGQGSERGHSMGDN